MIVAPVRSYPSMAQPYCSWCDAFPCDCQRAIPCACGGAIDPNRVEMIVALREHQATPMHGAWRMRTGL